MQGVEFQELDVGVEVAGGVCAGGVRGGATAETEAAAGLGEVCCDVEGGLGDGGEVVL